MKILAADIGGTHARFMAVELDGDGRLSARFRERRRSADVAAAPAGLAGLVAAMEGPFDAASFAVAGAVSDGQAVLTNLDWRIQRAELASALDLEDVRLLNDFEALGYAIPFLREEDGTIIQRGDPPRSAEIRALLGAGTGLGQALVVSHAGRRASVHATEGGHVSFAPGSEAEWRLRGYLAKRHDHVSWERVLSGRGLSAVYDFLVETGDRSENASTRSAMAAADPASVIVESGLDGSDPICSRALDIFIKAYGARAGDVALSTGATGGIYLAGGIAVRLRDRLMDGEFRDAFLDKGRMSAWLERVPVQVIAREDAGTIGAAIAALDISDRERITGLPNPTEDV